MTLCAAILCATPLWIGSGCRSSIDDALAEAQALQELGQIPEAIELLRGVLEQDRANPEANLALGAALLQSGQHQLAVTHLLRAEESAQLAVPAGLLLGSSYLALGQADQAVAAATRVLALDADQLSALRIRANAHVRLGDFEASVADAEAILTRHPDDYQALALQANALINLGRLDPAREILARIEALGVERDDASVAARGCIGLARFYAEGTRDAERASREYDRCVERYGEDPYVVRMATDHYDRHDQRARSTALLERLLAARPASLGYRQELARRLVQEGRDDEARALLVAGAKDSGSSQAWQALALFERNRGDYEAAVAALDEAIELAPDQADLLRFVQADVRIDQGELAQAEAATEALALPVYRDMIRGRILMTRGEYQGALAAFEAGLKAWPRNAGARFMAGQAARAMGDPERALKEYREATLADPAASDAALVAASILHQRGEFEQAEQMAARHASHRSTYMAEAAIQRARSLSALGRGQEAAAILAAHRATFGLSAPVVATQLAVTATHESADAAIALADASGLDLRDPENEAVLRNVAVLLATRGRAPEALARVAAAAAAHPEDARFHELQGRLLLDLGRDEEARGALARALALDANLAPVHASLAALALRDGAHPAALRHAERAVALTPDDGGARYTLSLAQAAAGDDAGAERSLREAVRLSPGHVASANDLAWRLAQKREDLDRALALAQRAATASPSATMLDTLGFVQLQRGEAQAAADTLRRALELEPKLPGTRYRLGLALAELGDTAAARQAFAEALRAGAFEEAGDARARLSALEQKQ